MVGPDSTSEPDLRLDDLRAEVWRVEALGQRLHPDAWEMESRCEDWTVADVFGHLATDFERYRAWLARALDGNAEPPFLRGELAADNAMLLERFAGVEGKERARAFVVAANEYIAEVAEVDPDLPQGNPLGVITVGEQVVWATIECALHGWDVADAIGIAWPGPASVARLAVVWRERRIEPLDDPDPWTAMLLASGRQP